MENKAKCRLCGSIIQSYTLSDVVSCDCGEITIWGGQYEFNVAYKNKNNLLRIDDKGNEVIVRCVDTTQDEIADPEPSNEAASRKERLATLDSWISYGSNLPRHVLDAPPSLADLYHGLLLVSSVLHSSDE